MSKLAITLLLVAHVCSGVFAAHGQASQGGETGVAPQQHLIGEVTAIDAATGRITIKTEAGALVTIKTDERTLYRRLPPGETSLRKAEAVTRADLGAGDRVLVPGGAAGDGQTAASQIIVTARDAHAERAAREREDWRRRSVAGRVAALDAGKREIILEARSREGARTITVDASADGVRFSRYAPDSLRRSDARRGAFADIQVGDQLRALGERSADGARVTAEEIISGSVTRIVGSVSAIDAARGEVTVKENRGRTLVIVVGKNTTLRRIPREVAEELAGRGEQPGEQRREAASDPAKPQPRPAAREASSRFSQACLSSLSPS